jgi:uncharacterized protein YkwD
VVSTADAFRTFGVPAPIRANEAQMFGTRAKGAWAAAIAVTATLATTVPSPAGADPAHTIDRSSRAAVVDAYVNRLFPTRAVDPGWTGSTATCTVGTESVASKRATLQAVNYYRAMAGLQPVSFDEALNTKALASALMMHAGNRLSHTPDAAWPCYNAAGAEAANRSNLGLGYPTGGATVVGYMADRGVTSVGHRLWILHPGLTTMGTGSTGRANSLWVVPGGRTTTPPGTPAWATWPTAGWFPWADAPTTGATATQGPTALALWSAGSTVHPNADYSAATVTATADGEPLSVTVVNRAASVGSGRSIVFNAARPGGAAFDTTRDGTVTVTVSGVRSGTTTLEPLRYSVNLFALSRQGAPVDPRIAFGDSNATVSWTAPTAGDAPVDHYRVQLTRSGATLTSTVPGSSRTATFAGVVAGARYTATVTAVSAAGETRTTSPAATAPPASTTPTTAPPAPTPTTTAPPAPAPTPTTAPPAPAPTPTTAPPATTPTTPTSDSLRRLWEWWVRSGCGGAQPCPPASTATVTTASSR